MTRYDTLPTTHRRVLFTFQLCLFFSVVALRAQDYPTLVRTAERLYADGKYADAGEYFEKAWRVKTQKQELIFRAGECYYWMKDYRKAADCYQFVKRENERFPLVGLKYARSLKQDGRYREAMEEFKWFARDYKGPGKEQLDKIIVSDIKGCEMGIELAAQKPKTLPIEVQILPEWVNSPENEFAPVPFTDDLLYFSSLVGGRAKLFRTARQDGQWSTPIEPQGLPEMAAEHFGSGAFSPDGSRFYFTQCSAVNPDLVGGNGLRAHCEIFVIRRSDGGWGQPERLRDYINMANCTNTHPFVAQERGVEYLFFASDRDGGSGGLDLYMCERTLEGDDLDFSFPQNLGEAVNTGGDEITPFFEPQTQTLFFSSNGHTSLGGMDVFKTVRAAGRWTKPENLGVPFNSTCDDFFFSPKKSGNGGFFVSNRMYGRAKTSTRHEDIFEFFPRENQLFATGKVSDSSTGLALADCMVGLYETSAGEEPRLLQVRPSADGTFRFAVFPDRNYAIEASKDGYQTALVPVTAQYATPNGFDIGIAIKPETKPAQPISPDLSDIGDELTITPIDSKEAATEPEQPAEEGLIFKIQLEAVPTFLPDDPKYAAVRGRGRLSSEIISAERNIVRIMLGNFEDKKTANDLARELRNSGAFPQAFVVKYFGGMRL